MTDYSLCKEFFSDIHLKVPLAEFKPVPPCPIAECLGEETNLSPYSILILVFMELGSSECSLTRSEKGRITCFNLLATLVIVYPRGVSSLITQTFSYEWFKSDWEVTDIGKLKWIFLVHLFQCGIFIRYWFALKYGFQAAFKQKSSGDASETDPSNLIQKQAIDAVTDINMLRVFKTFLDTTPQLFVQIYILMEHGKTDFYQCIFIRLYIADHWHIQMKLTEWQDKTTE
ncbi:hypothetical protein WISP_88686 [Willisornis vidua]|uniref:XK-related protein n=1 Tax=Willisornis vidua TaxID=1566151 RepID=A0ABQ9D3B2_9PASS|nr:hypothetical protein WISP_88686 [Willisornis vidua]